MTSFGLSFDHWKLLERILITPLKSHGVRLWVFGSRARGDFKKFSDLDILYQLPEEGQPLPSGFLSTIAEQLEDSRLPIRVDLVDQKNVADSYYASIMKDKVAI